MTTTISSSIMSDSDSIFNSPTVSNLPSTQYLLGGGETLKLDDVPSEITSNFVRPPTKDGQFVTYFKNTTVELESIGMPVYLAGIIQLLSVMILLSKKKTREASISFFTIGIYMLIVHCIYAGKANKWGQLDMLCRNLSYLMVLLPLINVILVLVDDFSDMWRTIKYSPGKLRLQFPNFQVKKKNTDYDDEDQ